MPVIELLRQAGPVLLGRVPACRVTKAVVPSRFFSPALSARAQAKAEAVRCRMGQCQNDASGAVVGVVATYRDRDKVYPICEKCQTLVLITGTRTAPYDPRGNSVLRGADNDVLMVGGRRVTRRAKA